MLAGCALVGLVPTRDKVRAREFYCGVLGLPFVKDDGFALVVQLKHGLMRIVTVPSFEPYAFTLLGWEVPEIEQEVQTLTAAGVAFERFGFMEQDGPAIWTAPDGSRVAWFKDPDGNLLSLSKHL